MTTPVIDQSWSKLPHYELGVPSWTSRPPQLTRLMPHSEQGVYSELVRELVSELLQLVPEYLATEKSDDYSVRSLANEVRLLRQDIQNVYREVKSVQQLEERVGRLEQLVPAEKVIVIRDISREAAKEEIKRLFSDGSILYYSDIAAELGLNLSTVVDICNELIAESEIEEVKNQQTNA